MEYFMFNVVANTAKSFEFRTNVDAQQRARKGAGL
jgi:hypothetical protein